MTGSPESLDVLVVEDDASLLRTLADILRLRGYTPHAADTGREGLRYAVEADEPPAIALVDLQLPDMDGMEVVQRLRAHSAATEVVILTGNASVESAVGALRQHSCDYLIKPVAPDQLFVTLRRATERWLRRRAEAALQKSEERFRRLIEGIGDVVFLIESDLRIGYVSPSVSRVLGFAPEGVVGRSVLDFFQSTDALTRLGGAPREVHCRHRDGTNRVLQVSTTDLREHPQLRGIVVTARDVTQQKQLEIQAMQAHRMDSVGRLAGGLAHDFNNILCVVLGSVELAMLEPGLPASVDRYLREVKAAGERAAALTRQLLQFGRRSRGEARVLDLAELARGLMPLLRRLIDENVSLEVDCGADAVPVRADPAQLEQVILNLVVNARDAMPDGGTVRVAVGVAELGDELARRHDGLDPGRYAVLTVRDTGVGMSDEVRLRAFEPFFTTKEVGRGTGLGLSICYGAVRQLGGSIALTSELGRGTSVEIALPIARGEPSADGTPAEVQPLPRGGETVLLVEDNAGSRAVTVSMLEQLHYRVVSAGDAQQALERLEREPGIDLVVTDVVMPFMSGPELVRRVRAARPDLRALFVSGYPRLNDKVEDLPGPLLAKPFTLAELANAVRAVLDAASS